MNNQIERFKEYLSISRFNAIKISVASPEKIKSLSYGEVKKIETINYRTLKPERDGLFCARIFGPVKDWECNCGKYKRMKHRGVTCEKCGVEVIQARVRRERMGHVELVAPVVHIWYLKGIPSYLSLILDMAVKDLERVVYFDAYMVIRQGLSPYSPRTLLTTTEFLDYIESKPEDLDFYAETGAEAVLQILHNFDLTLEISHIKKQYSATTSAAVRHRFIRRMKVLNNLMQSNIRPDWMVMKVLPVLPPDLRPLVPLEGGRFASSDLNELYRRVLNRNIRLQRLIEIEAPSVIIKNEKRMLQESVDALIDNGRRGQYVRGSNKRPLKSLSEMLRGKQGRFRQNLLGRRVDYSGRSVIVVDPELKLDQCGLPKMMALELFKPYVYAGLMEHETVPNMRVARRLVDELDPLVWDVLEEVVHDRPIILNRAPTLHRLGIQAFYPLLVDGKAIKIHPLVCQAFNADFDGDQMAVHIPLSKNAQAECKNLILSSRNILSPANGKPLTCPSQDMVLGLYYITKVRMGAKGQDAVFPSVDNVISAYQCGAVDLHASVKVRLMSGEIVSTTVGRVILYDALPVGSDFAWINKVMNKSDLAKMVERVYYRFEHKEAVETLDKIKKLGFSYATRAGISISIENLIIPEEKDRIIQHAFAEVERVEKLYMDGVITNGERRSKVISIWFHATAEVATAMYKKFEEEDKQAFNNGDRAFKPFNPIFMMLDSGARGTKDQVKQLVGMRGAMAKPNGEVIETPVCSNFKEGLKVFEYFTSTHGARKGQSDVALKTANSGYLTRRLVDVAHDVVITAEDCQTLGYVEMEDLKDAGDIICPLAERVFGRVVAADVKDVITGDIVLTQGSVITRDDLPRIFASAVSKIPVRSVLTCQAKRGICARCYGYDLSKSALVEIGTPVGVIAAQSIGEPGTQLTMRTFHIGGTASGLGEQSFFVAKNDGVVLWKGIRVIKDLEGNSKVVSRRARIAIISKDGRELQQNSVEYGSVIYVQNGQEITAGTKLVEWDPNNTVLLTETAGYVSFIDLHENITFQERFDEATKKSDFVLLETRGEKYQPACAIMNEQQEEIGRVFLPAGSRLSIVNGQYVNVGDILVKMPREAAKTKDITGGLPRISELFEARAPKDPAVIADIDGQIVIGGIHRGYRKVSIVSGAETREYLIPRGKQLSVVDGETVAVGDFLTSGLPVLQDILQILGPDVAQKYLVDQIEQIYRLQGVSINAKHYELIVRQMTRKVRIVERGDSDFMIGDRIDRVHFQMVNSALRAEGKKVAVARPVVQGLIHASLGTESFISAASFQETTGILTAGAIAGQIDYLYGLKENVIVGKVIPAGTGVGSFKQKYLGSNDDSN
ncbi:DNA-directed RNA polymerase subunit beta' [bacterium]|nr:MAG: DNA-directed RNA polymerase subunit beta' [bacterium]QQR61518.1 MAG: DNA-directed RNA polymerase subunit beta' [bacterium]QQR62954.1 MAG: DNA-directed RNA polymerase subunit beta' [bacterium]